jgi:hypothetical protein
MSAQIHFFCHAGPTSGLSIEACCEIALEAGYKCAPDESPLTCERCGIETREHYAMPGHLYELLCMECFVCHGGPESIRDEAARNFQNDQEAGE